MDENDDVLEGGYFEWRLWTLGFIRWWS